MSQIQSYMIFRYKKKDKSFVCEMFKSEGNFKPVPITDRKEAFDFALDLDKKNPDYYHKVIKGTGTLKKMLFEQA
jgi:hypothetical protein